MPNKHHNIKARETKVENQRLGGSIGLAKIIKLMTSDDTCVCDQGDNVNDTFHGEPIAPATEKLILLLSIVSQQ